MGDIAFPLIATDWVPNAQGYNGLFDFSHCPKPELVQAIGNDTSHLQSLDHLVQHTLSLPTEMDAWPLTTAFQLFGVVVYNDGALVSSTSRTINAVWNGKQVAAQVWSAVPGNPCVYFEFQVDDPGTTVPTGDDPCNPPVAKLSFAGTDAARSDFEMVVSSAFLVGQSRPISPPEPEPEPGPPPPAETTSDPPRICTRDLPADTRKAAPSATQSTSASVTPPATSFPSASDSETPADQWSRYTSGSSTSTMPTATSISRSTMSTPTTATTTSTPSGEPNRQTTTAAVGIAVGSAALFIVLLSVLLIRRRTQRRRREKEFLAPYDRETAVPPNQEPKRRFEEKIEGQTERRVDTGVEDTGFRDFYSAMRRAGLTVQSLLEHHSGPSDRSPDRLPDYTAR